MNKVITINLGGTAFQLEEAGYDALRAYLDTAAGRLQGNPDRDEIMSDIEQAIGEKFRAVLNSYKTVVVEKEVAAALADMGPIEGDEPAHEPGAATSGSEGAQTGPAAASAHATVKRLYRINEGEMLHGVCNGLAAYFGLDPTIVRLLFVLLTIFWGTGLLAYYVMVFVVPAATTPEEKAAATGSPFTAQEFIRRAKAGYYDTTKSFPDKHARREWKRQFKREMRGWRTSFERETHAAAWQWRSHWHNYWAQGAHPAARVALPLFSVLHAALAIVWLCALISLLATGSIFGVSLPGGIPAWVGLLLMMFGYGMLVWPLKMARRAIYYHGVGGPGWTWPVIFVVDALIWIAFVGVLLWLAVHYLPQAKEAVHHAPAVFREALADIKEWWRQQ